MALRGLSWLNAVVPRVVDVSKPPAAVILATERGVALALVPAMPAVVAAAAKPESVT
jgi:hypothetical protein